MRSSDHKTSLVGEKIVSASGMAAYEKILIQKEPGLSEIYMDAAALGMFHCLEKSVLSQFEFSKVILLVGKGNNGGDAFALGALFLKAGYQVIAFQISETLSDLSSKKAAAFDKEGGKRYILKEADHIKVAKDDLIIDGLLGTGFKGIVKDLLASVIEKVNKQEAFIFSIDIPSGVNGNTGKVEKSAIFADMTAYLGALKVGHLFEDGIEHVGQLSYVDFGMNIQGLVEKMSLANYEALDCNLPKRKKKDHKYSVGKVIIIAGSKSMPGAAFLATNAALRSGAGLVRHFTSANNPHLIPEVISSNIDFEKIDEELKNTKALLIGPGLGRSEEAKKIVQHISQLSNIPLVVDADALFLLKYVPEKSVLTPHRGELIRLLETEKDVSDEKLLEEAEKYVKKHKVIIVWKGMPTVIVTHTQKPICLVSGNPGMATAGSGDVLAGILVSFLGQGLEAKEAAVLAVMAHGRAGDIAMNNNSMRSMIAGDIIDSLKHVL